MRDSMVSPYVTHARAVSGRSRQSSTAGGLVAEFIRLAWDTLQMPRLCELALEMYFA
jgi:hypothetical protein